MSERVDILDLADVVSLEDAALRLGCTLDHLEMMAAAATLRVIEQPRPAVFGGGSRLVIERGELERVAGLLGHAEAKESPAYAATLEFLLGALLHVYTAEDGQYLDHPYIARDFIANDLAQALEIQQTGSEKQARLYRTRESDAEAIAASIKRFRASGLYRTPEQRQRDAEIAEARERNKATKPEEKGAREAA